MNNSTVQFRIDKKIKRAVTDIFRSLGLDLSSGFKMYAQQVVKKKGIPFPLLTENGFTQEQEAQILAESRETEEIYRRGLRRPHKSVKAMIKEIMSS